MATMIKINPLRIVASEWLKQNKIVNKKLEFLKKMFFSFVSKKKIEKSKV